MTNDPSYDAKKESTAGSHNHALATTSVEAPAHKMVRKLISGMGEGGLLLLLTCLSYALAYCYKVGQYRAFNLPLFLVSIDLNDCLRAGGAVLSGVFTLFIFLNVPFAALNFLNFKRIGWKYLCVFLLAIYSVHSILSILYEVSWTSFLLGLAIIAGALLLIVGLLALALKFKSKKEATKSEYNDLYDWLRQTLGTDIFICFMFLPGIGFLVDNLGYSNARKQKEFFQISSTQLVLIDSTSTGLICKSIDESKTRFTKGFTILSGDEIKKLAFESKSLAAWSQNATLPASKEPSSAAPPKMNSSAIKEPDSTAPTANSAKLIDTDQAPPTTTKPTDRLNQ